MKKIKIYITAPESEYTVNRFEIENFFRILNNCYLDKDLYFSLNMRDERKLTESDIVFFMFAANAGENIIDEYNTALQSFKKSGKPKIAVYFKVTDEAQSDETEEFRERLNIEGEYYNTYRHIDTVKLGLLMQIKQLDLDGVDIRLEDGKAWQNGTALMPLDNVEMVSGYEDLQRLKTERAVLEGRFYEAKTKYAENPGDDKAYEAFYEAAKQRNEAVQEIRDIETRLYHMIDGIYEQTTQGRLSQRQIEGYKLIERGQLKEARSVLDFGEIVSESRYDEMQANMIDKRAQVHVNELLQLIDVNMTLRDWAGVDECYKEAVKLEEQHNLPRKAELEYVKFLRRQNRQPEGIAEAEKLYYYFQNPNINVSDADKGNLYHSLGTLYADTQRTADAENVYKESLKIWNRLSSYGIDKEREKYKKELILTSIDTGFFYWTNNKAEDAENMYKSVLEECIRSAERNPNEYEPCLALLYNDLGIVYNDTYKMKETEEAFKSAIKIYTNLFLRGFDEYEFSSAATSDNLGVLYFRHKMLDEAENMFKNAKVIYEKFAEINPETHNRHVATVYSHLGYFYKYTQQVDKSAEYYKASLEIYKRLAARNPDTFEPILADTYQTFGYLYHLNNRMPEAERFYKNALEIYAKQAEHAFDAVGPGWANCYSNIGDVYYLTGRLAEAEEPLNKALEIQKKLMDTSNPVLLEPEIANNYIGLCKLYRDTQRLSEAENVCRTAMQLYEKYEADSPWVAEDAAKAREVMKSLYDLQENNSKYAKATNVDSEMSALTPEEREIAMMLIDGKSRREISRALHLSVDKVKQQITSILGKVSLGDYDAVTADITETYRLSKRESDMLKCLRKRMTNAEIAESLVVTEETVRSHIYNLMKKLPDEARADVVSWSETFADEE